MSNTDAYLQENPQYIVVFERPSPENTDLLARVLEAPLAEGAVQTRATRTVLQSRNGVHARVYTRLGVAAANLTLEQVRALEAHPEVVRVARNLRRRLPPVYRDMVEGPDSDGDRVAYLRGMRDMLNHLLGDPMSVALTSSVSMDSPGFRAPQFLDPWNRALEQLGLTVGYTGPTGKGVKVAVLDTGLDLKHPDLRLLEGNGASFVPNEPDVDDHNGHGTHCAGVIAATASPASTGRYSVAPNAELLVGKVLNRYGYGDDDHILDGIDWAVDQGADIISLSLGGSRSLGQPFDDTYERVAQNFLEQNVLIVAAAGNDSVRPGGVRPLNNPAACPSVLAVGAVDHLDRVAVFSCAPIDGIGEVDVVAPGVGILSARAGGGYVRLSGTSMAAPHVAGIAALLREGAPNLTARELWERLKSTARRLGVPAQDVGAGVAQVPIVP